MAELKPEMMEIKVELEDRPRSVVVHFGRTCLFFAVRHQDATLLAEQMEALIPHLVTHLPPEVDRQTHQDQCDQIAMGHDSSGHVCLAVQNVDRVRYTSLQAFAFAANKLKMVASDAFCLTADITPSPGKERLLRVLHAANGVPHA